MSNSAVADYLVSAISQDVGKKKERKLYEIGKFPKTVEEMREAVDKHFREVLARTLKEQNNKEVK